MRLSNGKVYLITIMDGTVLRGKATRSWRWKTAKLTNARAILPNGQEAPTAGPVLVPHRSMIVAQEVPHE